MQGRVDKDTFIIMDSFALPVEATEVRVNAGAEAYEYMAQFLSLGEAVRGRTGGRKRAFFARSPCICVWRRFWPEAFPTGVVSAFGR
jgi:hypothetical protein